MKHCIFLLLLACTVNGFAVDSAESIPQPGRGGTTNVEDTKTPDEKLDGWAEFQDELAEMKEIVDSGNPDELMTRMLAHKQTEASRMVELRDKSLGRSGDIRSGSIPILGLGEAKYTVRAANPNFLRAYTAPGRYFDIVSSGTNIAGPVQQQLDKLKKKVGKKVGACGGFDWVSQLQAQFSAEALQEYLTALQEGVVAAAPMALLANFSPTLYEIVKHLKALASADIAAALRNCQTMENALTNVGRKALRGTGYADCMEANREAGINAANAACNQSGSSIFDGIENSVGKIVSPVLEDGSVDLVSELTDFIAPKRDESFDQEFNIASNELAEANANLAANPAPGGDPSTWTAAQREAQAKHEAAESRLKRAQATLEKVSQSKDAGDAGLFSRLRGAIADNLPDILGEVRVSVKGDIQIGNQDRAHISLLADHVAYRWSNEIRLALTDHWKLILRAYSPSGGALAQADLSNSYNVLRAHLWETMQYNWTKEGLTPVSDYDLDRLAHMWYAYNLFDDGSTPKQDFIALYPVESIINAVSHFESTVFALQEFDKLERDTLDQLTSMESGRNSPLKIREVITGQMGEYRKIIEKRRDKAFEDLLIYIPVWQSYEMPKFTVEKIGDQRPIEEVRPRPRFFQP